MNSCFALGTSQAFWIYALDPAFKREVKRPFKGGIKIVQMVGISSLVLLVATGDNPEYPSDQVLIWDEKQLKVLLTMDMNEPVLSLSFSNEMFMVGMQYSVTCCALFSGSLTTIATGVNPRGVHAVSSGTQAEFCLATPAKTAG